MAYTNVWAVPLSPYGNSEKLRQCPETSGNGARELLGGQSFGTSTTAWSEFYAGTNVQTSAACTGSFAINGWFSAGGLTDEDSNLTDNDDADAPFSSPLPSMSRLLAWARSTQNVPAFADAVWSDARPNPYDRPPPNLYTGPFDPMYQMERVCIARHRKTVNVSFVDGHAENTPLQQLWALNWKPGWKPPDPLPKMP